MTFDAERLKEEAGRLPPNEWVSHFNTAAYRGDWSALPLRSLGGRTGQIYPDPAATEEFADTHLLARCPYHREVLRSFPCPLLSVRLLKLSPDSRIREHRDHNLGFEDGEIRVHIPVQTHPDVAFLMDGEPVEMAEGETWYIDF
jgi:hypothetical protein